MSWRRQCIWTTSGNGGVSCVRRRAGKDVGRAAGQVSRVERRSTGGRLGRTGPVDRRPPSRSRLPRLLGRRPGSRAAPPRATGAAPPGHATPRQRRRHVGGRRQQQCCPYSGCGLEGSVSGVDSQKLSEDLS